MVIEYDKDLLKCNEFLPLCLALDTPLIFLLSFQAYHIQLYVTSYQKHSMTHIFYTSPLLITVVVKTDLTVFGSLVLHFLLSAECCLF